MKEFHEILNAIAKISEVQRMIPWRIERKQSWSSAIYFTCSYPTNTGRKYKMSKGSTSQELFVICGQEERETVKDLITKLVADFFA